MPFSLYYPLAWGACVPAAPLNAPAGLTGLWLAPAWKNPILWWSAKAGWRSVFSMGAPARAQVTTPPLSTTGTWIGEVVAHDGHFDYVGSPCPVEVEVCAGFIARYRIVPTTVQAFFALPLVAGRTAVLTATLRPVAFGQHQGILLVSAVS
jgi:hypothetical protein